MTTTTGSAFQFLALDSPKLLELAVYAEERFRAGDAIACVTALRTFGEEATKILLDGRGLDAVELDHATQARRIEDLFNRGKLTNFAYNGLHVLRSVGNEAVHDWSVSPEDARRCLERAYEVALAERGVLAPHGRVNLTTDTVYELPVFGETQLTVDGLVEENAQLREQIEEVQRLIETQTAEPEEHAGEDEDAEQLRAHNDAGTLVRLRWVAELCEAQQELERLRRHSRRERPRTTRAAARLSDEFKRVRKSITRLEYELRSSFFVERQLAALLARRHMATEVRRQREIEGRDWPAEWEQEFTTIECQIQQLSNASTGSIVRGDGGDGPDPPHLEILDCFRRLELAETLKREFADRNIAWPPAWSRAQTELRRRRERLIAMVATTGSMAATREVDAGD